MLLAAKNQPDVHANPGSGCASPQRLEDSDAEQEEQRATCQEPFGNSLTGCLGFDLYACAEWNENDEAAKLLADAIERALHSANSRAVKAIRART